MKRLFALLLTLSLVILPSTLVFANEKAENDSIYAEAPLVFQSNEKASTHGSGGTAYIGYMSSKHLNWRITSSKGIVILFSGTVEIRNSKNMLVASYPISGGGSSTISGQIDVKYLKKGDYKAILKGTGTTGGGVLVVKSGLVQMFTI
ncbi:hypothetical protein I5976_16865 [Clostridioides difficile]|uniref:hypothetical protein n=1 Tax=Clostridioides difficile TaxID=1496 RepID=UPI00038D13D8|nr:hypothetical protein [Clostridioides difficile]OFU03345.1 hypothetical protein HMPREF3083_12855 [Clostridium sp. HMSC19D07]OFU33100.1 hypothetical protein HMPREF3075_06260 [Clostridium sp. HMSC19B11]EGT3847543.1 hypothetical protein [Clostridioides difficile]EGT4053039.1 hypothetical protein [Clostridioides difficile]EGT4533170.1 hypothetical protein [Clostridioides difficile]